MNGKLALADHTNLNEVAVNSLIKIAVESGDFQDYSPDCLVSWMQA